MCSPILTACVRLFCGSGPLRPALEALALRLGLAVDFTGGVYEPALLADRLAALDVVVNPSLRAWSEHKNTRTHARTSAADARLRLPSDE